MGNPAWKNTGLNNEIGSMKAEVFKKLSAGTVWRSALSFVNILAFLIFLLYAYFLYKDLSPYWFNPNWTTDDALQQIFPFHSVYHPEIFKGDLIAETMKGYLAPLHYWLCYVVTWLVGGADTVTGPLMMAHWVMLIQLVLTVGFLFLAVRHAAGLAPALFAVTWFLHTRPVLQRITCGLPRGWAGAVLTAFLYFALTKNHKGVLISLFCGCLLHPPAALVAAGAYGLYLLQGVLRQKVRPQFLKPFFWLAVLTPLYIATTFYVVHRPKHIGQMVGYQEASQMPEFQRPAGRFPFLPLEEVSKEVKLYGYQPFNHRLYTDPNRFWKRNMFYFVIGLLFLLALLGWHRKRRVFPVQLLTLFLSIVIVYYCSRLIPFKLYVPNRHLQVPMSVFLISIFSIGFWRALVKRSDQESLEKEVDYGEADFKKTWPAMIAFVLLGTLIWAGTGNGLYGTANFNYSLNKKGRAFRWIRRNTEPTALVAGHPTHIDALQLFGIRKAYATTETTHPFYPGYYNEIKRRLIISLKAHYARSLREVVDLLEPEGIDYFIFSRKRFYPASKDNPVGLKYDKFFSPLNTLVNDLTARHYEDYAYKQLPREVDLSKAPFMFFKDEQSAVVGIKELKAFLKEK
jgi:hypothetical protein